MDSGKTTLKCKGQSLRCWHPGALLGNPWQALSLLRPRPAPCPHCNQTRPSLGTMGRWWGHYNSIVKWSLLGKAVNEDPRIFHSAQRRHLLGNLLRHYAKRLRKYFNPNFMITYPLPIWIVILNRFLFVKALVGTVKTLQMFADSSILLSTSPAPFNSHLSGVWSRPAPANKYLFYWLLRVRSLGTGDRRRGLTL